jgi:hypothetical protein
VTDINDIKIIGIDEDHPPMVRKESYIDLFFRLSVKAPTDWCEDFNTLGHRIAPPAKIAPAQGLIIQTYVHDMKQIQEQLDKIKQKIIQCNKEYLEKERQKQLALAAKRADMVGSNAKQNQLNEIIAGLKY